MKKNMIAFNLMDAMTEDRCPVCFLVKKRTLQLMDGFLYEGVNDSDRRADLLRDGGFCPRHGKMLMDMGNPLAHAIIYQDLIRQAAEDAEKDSFDRYAPPKKCLFCREEKNTEKDYLTTFARAFQDGDFQEKYRQGGMLCMTHLQMLRDMKAAAYPQIRTLTVEKYQHLLKNLSCVIHKNDYRFADEPWEKDAKDSWKRAVQVMNGGLL